MQLVVFAWKKIFQFIQTSPGEFSHMRHLNQEGLNVDLFPGNGLSGFNSNYSIPLS